MSTASVSCHTSNSLGPSLRRWICAAMASQTGAHSVPGEDKIYSTPSLRNASTMALPPSNRFFMVGLLERFSCAVYYLTPERARPLADINCGAARSQFWRVESFRAVEKLSRSPSTGLRVCPEFIGGTNGQVLIFPFTIFNRIFTSDIAPGAGPKRSSVFCLGSHEAASQFDTGPNWRLQSLLSCRWADAVKGEDFARV